ncbi:MAG: hypothetical protein ACOYM3_18795, partial [Terrimicrobiaceae bacterium]
MAKEVTAKDRAWSDLIKKELERTDLTPERREDLCDGLNAIGLKYNADHFLFDGEEEELIETTAREGHSLISPQSPDEIAATPEFIATCANLVNALWSRGVDSPEKFAQVMHESFPDKITPRILSQVWGCVEKLDIDQGVNWSLVLDEVRNPPSNGDVSDYDEEEDDDSPDNEIDELDQPIL